MRQPLAIFITDTHLSESTIEINKKIFNQVFMLAEELNCKTIIHGGDCFTSRKGQSEIVLNTFKEILDQAAKRELKIYAIAGNHDKTDTTSDSSFLNTFDGHPAFTVLGAGAMLDHENVNIYFLPYYDEQLSYPKKLNEIVKVLDRERMNILITHVGIDGVRSNSGILIDNEVTQEMFEIFSYVLIGHYHDRQALGSREHIIYTGSAYQANHGEDPNKGVVVIYDDPIDPIEFIELDFPRYVTVEVLPEDLTKDLVDQIKAKSTEAKVRIKIKGDLPEEKKAMLVDLQGYAKIELEKESFVPLDTIGNKDLSMSSNDIMESFDKWTKEKNVKNVKFGRQLLQKTI